MTMTDDRPTRARVPGRRAQEAADLGALATVAAAEAEAYVAIAAAATKIGDAAYTTPQVRDVCWRESKRLTKLAAAARVRAADLYDQAAARLRAS